MTVEELTKRIIDIARGAGLMTGATMEYRFFENSYDDLVYNENLKALLKQNLQDLGVGPFAPRNNESVGSTDIGNVSHKCPTVYAEIDVEANPSAFAHDYEFLKYVQGPNSDKTLINSIKAMAYTGLQVFQNPDLLK